MTPLARRAVELRRALRARRAVARCLASPSRVVVLTGPKTGSTSIEAALERADIPAVKLHHPMHSLAHRRAFWHGARQPVPFHAFCEARMNAVWSGTPGLRVLTMVRDPIAMHVSGIFQLMATGGLSVAGDADAAAEALRRIENQAAKGSALRWFDKHFAPWLGIDVFAAPFDKEAGRTYLRSDRAEALIVTTSALDRNAARLSEFVGSDLAIGRENVRAGTAMADRYAAVRRAIRPDAATLDAIYGSPRVRHFFTSDEIERFRATWTNA